MDRELRRLPFTDTLVTEMAKHSKEESSDELRLVEEAPEEVVRLDAPKMAPLEKKGVLSSAVVAPTIEKALEDDEERKRIADPETAWSEEVEEEAERTIPIGWFVLLSIIANKLSIGINFFAT